MQIIMFELFAGEVAFQGANLGHLIFQIGGFLGRALVMSPLHLLHPHASVSCLAPSLCWSSGGLQGSTSCVAVHKRERPPIPADCPADYTELMQRCWQNDAALRPTFKDVLASLQAQFSVLRAGRPKRGSATATAAAATPVPNPVPIIER